MRILKLSLFTAWLLVFSFSLTGQVSDTTCKAAFEAKPDSLTNFPFLYHFKDLSTGNINAWHWDFGDGSSGNEQNPSHQYNEAGTYKVCLTVADQGSGCSDQVCQDITTLEYFSLGGLVYAGEYPLNNPVVAGDTGVASLYRIVNNQLVFVEDHYFQDYGYYWFGYLFPGQYLVKVGLTPGSPNYNNYFLTYYGDDISWTKADLLPISNSSLYEAEIHLVPVQDLAAGIGIIRGYVKFEQGNEFTMPPISQTTVILSDINHTPLLFTQPNPAGYFEFTGLPNGIYLLTADATGKPASTVTITISDVSPVVEGINLTVFGSNVNYISDRNEKGIFLASIYPNPVKDNLYIKLYSDVSAAVNIKVIDVAGKTYYWNAGQFETGFNHLHVPTATLPAGEYLLVLQPQGPSMPVTAKFIK